MRILALVVVFGLVSLNTAHAQKKGMDENPTAPPVGTVDIGKILGDVLTMQCDMNNRSCENNCKSQKGAMDEQIQQEEQAFQSATIPRVEIPEYNSLQLLKRMIQRNYDTCMEQCLKQLDDCKSFSDRIEQTTPPVRVDYYSR